MIEAMEVVPHIVDTLPADFTYKSVTDRYFTRRYCVDAKGITRNDHLLLFHTNRLCFVTLAPSHPFFEEEGPYTVNFDIGNVDRSKTTVKGKGKKGGQQVGNNSTLCLIKFDSGKEFTVSSCINGKIIEANDALVDNPDLLRTHPDSDGFIAIILTNIPTSNSRKDELLSDLDYQACVGTRK